MSVAAIIMVCPSPDNAINAVYWWEGGGGAAGWAESHLTVMPSTEPAESVQKRNEGQGKVFTFAHGNDLRLRWETPTLLEVEYPDSSLVKYAAPGDVYTPELPTLRVRYKGVPADQEGSTGRTQCESGGRVIKPGPVWRVK